jgi:hypothetical protein
LECTVNWLALVIFVGGRRDWWSSRGAQSSADPPAKEYLHIRVEFGNTALLCSIDGAVARRRSRIGGRS